MIRAATLAALVAVAAAPAAAICPAHAILTGPVTRVVDGDTLIVGDTRIRLQGIAAPELEEPGGTDARTILVWLAPPGSTLNCVLTGERTHERCVAVCRNAFGDDLGEEMVWRGGARDCPRYSGGRYRATERDATAAGYAISSTYRLPRYCAP